MLNKFFKNQKGVSLLELVVAMALFVILILLATGIFQTIIQSQKRSLSSQIIQENMRYTFETMSREIRMAYKDEGDSCGLGEAVYAVLDDSRLSFQNQEGVCVSYYLEGDRMMIEKIIGAAPVITEMTPADIKINKLVFVLHDVYQPRVTFLVDAELASANQANREMKFQTTISSRYYESSASSLAPLPEEEEVFTCGEDIDYGGYSYSTVLINNQCWMAKNINIGEMITEYQEPSEGNPFIEKYCYNDSEINCEIYGGLYTWNMAMNYSEIEGDRGICPLGWHIPTNSEWYALEYFLWEGQQKCPVAHITNTVWECVPTGLFLQSPDLGKVLGGYRAISGSPRFQYIDSWGFLWSSSETSPENAMRRLFLISEDGVRRNAGNKQGGYSVRCIKD